MILIALGSPKLQDPNLVYAFLDDTYRHISQKDTLIIHYGNTLKGTDGFITEWLDERSKARDRVEGIILNEITDETLPKEAAVAAIFFQEEDENKEANKYVELLEAKTIVIEKYRSHNFLPKGNE